MPHATNDTHLFSARLPHDEYEALKAYAFFSRRSMNDVVIRAIRAYLTEASREQEIDTMVDAARRRLRQQAKRWNEG